MTNALDEQLSTAAKEKLFFRRYKQYLYVNGTLLRTTYGSTMITSCVPESGLLTNRNASWRMPATIASPSERQDYIAQEYASRRNAGD